jgi:hypothetical protein
MRDAADIYHYSRDTEVARHVLWDAHRSIADSRAYLRFMLRLYRSHEPASWGIEWRQTGEIIGTYVYRLGLGAGSSDYGLSTAVGLLNGLVSLLLILGANKLSKKTMGTGIW